MSILKKILEYIGLFLLLVLAIVIGTLIAYVVWISIHPQPAWYGPGWQGHQRIGVTEEQASVALSKHGDASKNA
jgi:hypothetical protein